MSKLLINESPVLVIPTLAVKLGVTDAIILQQVHYWLEKSPHKIVGRKWVYNTYKEWQRQIPFYSEGTIKRVIQSLEKRGYLVSANYNRTKLDKTKWYSINYEMIVELEEMEIEPSSAQDMPSTETEDVAVELGIYQAIPESTTKITTEKKIIPFSEIVQYLNFKTNATYKPGSRKTRELISARWNEGFTLADFKRVIDQKAEEWLNDPKWNRFLRPETLFGTKFESYLNQKPVTQALREEDFNLDD